MTVEDGFVPTPPALADIMAQKVLTPKPDPGDRILFPGAGTGSIAAAVHRYCSYHGLECPDAVAIDTAADRLQTLTKHVATEEPRVPPIPKHTARQFQPRNDFDWSADYEPVAFDVNVIVDDILINPPDGEFEYIVANPPFTRYNAIGAEKRQSYREQFRSTTGRFPLYWPFVEQMQDLLSEDGVLVFLAPVNYLFREAATAFRRELRRDTLHEFLLLPKEVFRHWKVETMLTVLEKEPSLGKVGYFWLESFVWKCVVTQLIEKVGITDPDRVEAAYEDYRQSYEHLDQLLRFRRQRQGEEGGYDISRIPEEYRPGESHQSDIGQWAN